MEDGHDGCAQTAGDRDCDGPGKDDVAEQGPIDTTARSLRPADENDRADFAVSRADGDADFAGHQDGKGSADFDGETARRCQFGQILADRFDDSPAPDPETDGDADASEEEDVQWRFRFLLDVALRVDEPDGHQRSDGVADVVSTVSERPERGRHDLKEWKESDNLRRVFHRCRRRDVDRRRILHVHRLLHDGRMRRSTGVDERNGAAAGRQAVNGRRLFAVGLALVALVIQTRLGDERTLFAGQRNGFGLRLAESEPHGFAARSRRWRRKSQAAAFPGRPRVELIGGGIHFDRAGPVVRDVVHRRVARLFRRDVGRRSRRSRAAVSAESEFSPSGFFRVADFQDGPAQSRHHDEMDEEAGQQADEAAEDDGAPPGDSVEIEQFRPVQDDGEDVDGQSQGVEDGQSS